MPTKIPSKIFWGIINTLFILSFYGATIFLDKLIKIHWSLGIIGIAILLVYILKSIRFLKNSIEAKKLYYIILSFARLIILSSLTAAGISYLIFITNLATYESPNPITLNSLSNFLFVEIY